MRPPHVPDPPHEGCTGGGDSGEEEGAPGPATTDEAQSYLDLFLTLVVHITLFVLIILCIFYSVSCCFAFIVLRKNKNKKNKNKNTRNKKKKKNQKHQPPFEATVGCRKPSFLLAVAACQPAATQPGPAATASVANLPSFAAAACPYRQLKQRQEPSSRLFLSTLNRTIYFRKIEGKNI
jgi:hypothetical protein